MASLLITGGSGTLGRCLIRHAIASGRYERIVSLSRDEQKVAGLAEEFASSSVFKAFIGDVRDRERLKDACRGIDIVVMAAALKRVDVTCYNPDELFKTNVLGVDNTIRAAAEMGVRNILLISSDKACSPSNPYGISKAMAECIATSSNVWAYPRGTRVSALRYGNVLGSRGSVIHTWRKQVALGQPITLTDRRMTRFILTIEAAVQFAQRCLDTMRGGEVFVPVLSSATIVDLARTVVPDQDYPVVEIGLRPGGEKLAELLLNEEETWRTLVRTDMYVVLPSHREWTTDKWEGEPMERSFVYRSDRIDRRLDVEELRGLVASTEACR